MFVHRSNRTERLVEVLVDVVSSPIAGAASPDPLRPECIVVSSRGMERWLSLALARARGVWANPDFPFPRAFIDRILVAAGGPAPGFAFEPEPLTWAIADVLAADGEDSALAPLRSYLADDPWGTRRLQLAAKVADTFDHYVVYRPEMLIDWENGQRGECPAELSWQPALWRRLVERHGTGHLGHRAAAALKALASDLPLPGGLPPRVSLFGVATLPRVYLELLRALGRRIEVHLFVPSPCREYWADLRPRRGPAGSGQGGESLLRSLGRLGREFQEILEEVPYQERGPELYEEPAQATLLAALQADVVALREPERVPASRTVAPEDDSISIHVCHGPMREVEVLHDRLIALFEADPTLHPHDVVVMAPDIEVYAPYVQAVFGAGAGTDERPAIPHGIADRHPRASHGVVDALMRALEVARGRLYAPEVFDLLSMEVVRDRFDIVPDELEQIRDWIARTGIRWGADAAHRARSNQPEQAENTWLFGLERLFLGYAVGEASPPWCSRTPFPGIEGGAAVVVGKLAEFWHGVSSLKDALVAERTVSGWCEVLEDALSSVVAWSDELEPQHRMVREAIAGLRNDADAVGFSATISADAAIERFEARLARVPSMGGFGGGSVTFCAMVPMRAIPFRVVCLLGMNDETFPRRQSRAGFDLIALHRRPGDRSARDDDRYLFLEALMSARERLIITYVGKDAQDDAPIPASIVIEELLDTLERTVTASGGSVREQVVFHHSIQPFGRRYFDGQDSRFFSYDEAASRAAGAAAGPRVPEAPFVPVPLGATSSPSTVIALEDLERFWRNPAKALLQRRLGIYLDTDIHRLRDREPLAPDALESWELTDRALKMRLEDQPWPIIRATSQGSGMLPGGALGATIFAAIKARVAALEAAARPWLGDGSSAPSWIDVDILVDGASIVGRLHGITQGTLVDVRASRIRPRIEMSLWLRHLVAACSSPDPAKAWSTTLVGRGRGAADAAVIEISGVAEPHMHLAELVRGYVHGQRHLLPFFPEASMHYATKLVDGDTAERALALARAEFEKKTGLHNPVAGEGADPYVRLAFRALDPFDPDLRAAGGSTFATMAEKVCVPLLRARRAS